MTAKPKPKPKSKPEKSIGISDINAHRECPRRAAYGLQRHTGEGTQNQEQMTPESGSLATWYGSMFHEAVFFSEDGFSDEDAIEKAWRMWGHHLSPNHLVMLKEDLEVYHTRDFPNTKTILAEGELKVFLCEAEDGTPIYFRCKIDRLYEKLDEPGHFIHVDYKTSAHPKSKADVDEDRQLWAYNWAIHEAYGECEELDQWYDQLKFGMLPTSKSASQREEVREWLELEARAALAKHELGPDGLPQPRFNEWCAFCPIKNDCPVIPRLSNWALSRITALEEEEDPSIDMYVHEFAHAQDAAKVLDAYISSVRELIRDLTPSRQAKYGFEFRDRKLSFLSPMNTLKILEEIGDEEFVKIVGSLSQQSLKKIEDDDTRKWALDLVESANGPKVLYRKKQK